MVAFCDSCESIDLEGVQPRPLLPVLKHRSWQTGFKQVAYNILVELRVVTPVASRKLPQDA